jgi:hypothetical protein
MPRSSYSPCWPPSDPIDRSISTASPPCSLRRLANPQAPINPGPHLAPASQARQRHRRQTTPPRSPSIERWPEPLPHFAPGCHRYRPIRPRLPTGQRPAVERGHCPTSTGVRTRPRKAIHAQSGYTWAYDEHAAARAEQVVGDVAARLVNLSGEAGDVAGIQWVIQRARRGLDGPTAELPPRLVERIWAARIAAPDLVRSAHEYAHELDATVDLNDRKGEYETRRDPVRAGLSS